MAITEPQPTATKPAYDLQGTLLEACSCAVLCPCWVGEDPDGGTCDAINAYHFDRGTVRGVDVGGLSFVRVVRIPGNVLEPGSWTEVIFLDRSATDEQAQALLDAYDGTLGGPLADVAGLIGRTLAVVRASIRHEVSEGRGVFAIDDVVHAQMRSFTGPDGSITTLRDSLFSTVPGSPAYVGIAETHSVDLPDYGMTWSFEERNAIQADFCVRHEG